ncbi:MAG: lipase [Clostridia bacterium]|nr:lipase [Clostridia bacterium]
MAHTKWVCGWSTPSTILPQHVCEYFKDMTFRYEIFPTVDGSALRIHLSNLHGHEPMTVNEATAALQDGPMCIDTDTLCPITFGGSASVTLQPGEEIISDPAEIKFSAGQTISISTYFAGLTEYYCGHSNNSKYLKKYMSHGNYAAAQTFPWETYGDLTAYLYFCAVDFLTDESVSAIVAYGDSITSQPWPDCLAHRLFDLGIRNRTVCREGIGGNRVLRDYTHRIKKHWGVRGVERFAHDIDRTGADRVIILHGINDIIHPGINNPLCPMSELPTPEELIEGYKTYIRIAREQGKKVYMATLLPCPRCMADDGIREQIRCAANDWIRSTDLLDGVVDFEAAVWDPGDHKQMFAEYDSGDHLHPSFAGAQHMAESVPLEFITE